MDCGQMAGFGVGICACDQTNNKCLYSSCSERVGKGSQGNFANAKENTKHLCSLHPGCTLANDPQDVSGEKFHCVETRWQTHQDDCATICKGSRFQCTTDIAKDSCNARSDCMVYNGNLADGSGSVQGTFCGTTCLSYNNNITCNNAIEGCIWTMGRSSMAMPGDKLLKFIN